MSKKTVLFRNSIFKNTVMYNGKPFTLNSIRYKYDEYSMIMNVKGNFTVGNVSDSITFDVDVYEARGNTVMINSVESKNDKAIEYFTKFLIDALLSENFKIEVTDNITDLLILSDKIDVIEYDYKTNKLVGVNKLDKSTYNKISTYHDSYYILVNNNSNTTFLITDEDRSEDEEGN